MTVDTPVTEASDTPDKPKRAAGKRTKTLQLTLTVTGTADGEWHAELKQGGTHLVRDLAVAAAAVSRAARELHEDLSTPIDAVIEEARSQQAAKVAALEAELRQRVRPSPAWTERNKGRSDNRCTGTIGIMAPNSASRSRTVPAENDRSVAPHRRTPQVVRKTKSQRTIRRSPGQR